MKRISLLTLLCCLLAGLAGAVTISGTVTMGAPGIPVVSQKVYVIDSFNTYRDSTVTDINGQYSFTLPTGISNPSWYYLNAPACGLANIKMATYTGSNMTTNFNISCLSYPTWQGAVTLGGVNTSQAMVYLIRKQYNPTLMDTTLTAIDSVVTNSTGHYAKRYASIPSGTLLLKAALLPAHSSYLSYLPTYDTISTTWSGARALTPGTFSNSTIAMIAGVNPGGPGFIGGSVLVGANKGTAVGDPLSQRILLLTNNAGQPVGYTYSSATGAFQFPNLAYGTYRINGDAWGKTNPQLTVTISPSKPSVSDVVFEENNKTFKGHIGSLSISTSAKLNAVTVYPNPVTDLVQFSGLDAISGSKTVVLSDVTGSVIARQIFEVGASTSMATANLAPGIYMLQVQSSEGTASFRIVK